MFQKEKKTKGVTKNKTWKRPKRGRRRKKKEKESGLVKGKLCLVVTDV